MKRRRRKFSGDMLRVSLLVATDLAWCGLVPLGVLWVYRLLGNVDFSLVPLRDFWIIPCMIVVINSLSRGYHGNILNPGAVLNRTEEIRRLSLIAVVSYALGMLFLFLTGQANHYPWCALVISMCVTVVGFPFARFVIRWLMQRLNIGQIRVLIAGAGHTAEMVSEELASTCYYGYEIVGYLDDDPAKRTVEIQGRKWIGRLNDASRLAKLHNVNHIICCLPPPLLPLVLRDYTRSFSHVLIVPTNEVLPITAIYPALIGFISGFEFQNRVLFLLPRLIKSLAEIVGAFIAIVLLLPLFCVLALLVKISSPGPVFYSARRLGRNGKEIRVLKFRSMYQDAEVRLESMLEENPALKAEWTKNFKLEHDPRVTPVGDFLRRTSLDELPQFINVLRGDMALIGPRPIVTDEVNYYGENYDVFKRVKPGITGLWQVSGRSDVDYDQRVAMDMFYVMNWSLWLDYYIFLKTFYVVLFRKGAH